MSARDAQRLALLRVFAKGKPYHCVDCMESVEVTDFIEELIDALEAIA